MTPVAYLVPALLGWIIAALVVGLWLGERGRRKAAEHWVLTGAPDQGKARPAVSRAPAKEAEDRWLQATQEATKETVDRMTADLMAEARAEGLTVDEKKLRRDVETMLAGQDVNE